MNGLIKGTIATVFVIAVGIGSITANDVRGTKHDLSSNATKSGDQSPCTYCHGAHGQEGEPALWGRTETSSTFTVYSSPTLNATMPQLAGVSRGCLSCHDGVTAFDALHGSSGAASGNNMETNYPGSPAILGFDLSNDHPVGIPVSADSAGIWDVSTIENAGLKLYSGKVECASCHEVHGESGFSYFLRLTPSSGALCEGCHNK